MAGIVYGFRQLLDNPDRRAVTIDAGQLQSALGASQDFHERETNSALALFSEQTTLLQQKFRGGSATMENQPLDEFGRTRPLKGIVPVEYTAGWPIYSSGQARGNTFLANVKMSIQKFNDELDAMYAGDFRWMRNRLLASIFTNVQRNFDDPESDDGVIEVMPLANGDATQYVIQGNVDATTTDNHFLAFPNPIDDANNPVPAIRTELIEHPVNGAGEVVILASSSVYNTSPTTGIHALTEFVEWGGTDPGLSVPTPVVEILRPLRMAIPASATYRGRVNQAQIVEWPALQAGYGIAVTTTGPRPFRHRVDPEPELRGFKPIAERADFPYFEDQWIRRMGFGAWNRVSALVFQIGAGAYTIPAAYQNMRWA